MPRIELLPPDVANQIAAGEVVERPASVVKELVENALDAGAETVTVSIDGGGLARISVTDDGGGMTPEDLALAVVRHATSKIRSAHDLVGVQTYGFRGEALPSIGSVSRMTLRSRARDAAEGAEAFVEGGAEAKLKPAGCATGTTITVEDLFYNTPARRKFMRSPQTEGAACVEAVIRMAIPRPDVRFVIRRDGKVVREFLRHKDLAARVKEVWPDETLADLRGSRGSVKVTALLGPPERARSGAGSLALYVNGRHVKDKVLMRAVAQAYGSTLEGGRYPVGALVLELPAEQVDVNVHPQKSEVRFERQGAIFEAVASVLREAAGTAPWARAVARPRDFWSEHLAPGPSQETSRPPQEGPSPEVAPATEGPSASSPALPNLLVKPASGAQRPSTPSTPSLPFAQPPRTGPFAPLPPPAPPTTSTTSAPLPLPAPVPPPVYPPAPYAPGGPSTPAVRAATTVDPPASAHVPSGAFGALRYVGQVKRMYLVCEGPDGLVILDQHAAAERVTFERLRRSWASRSVAMQPLLVPERVELAPEDVALAEERSADLLTLGLDLSPMGPTSVAVRGVPALVARTDPRKLARDVLAELGRQGNDFSRAVDLVLATMACHGSVRGGDLLADEEARALLTALDTVDFAGHCPHGRPVVFSMKWPELERKVGR